jgi:hypothetical protein
MKQVVIIILLGLVFSSCEKVIDPGDLPEQDARLVINTILKTDTVFSVYLSSSKSIVSGKDYKTVDNAYCAVYENDVFVEQLVFKSKGIYVGTKKAVTGKTYKVVARATGFADADGTTAMPNTVEIKNIQRTDTINGGFYVSQTQTTVPSVGGGMAFKINLKENPSVPDYYAIAAQIVLYDTLDNVIAHTMTVNVNENGLVGTYYGGVSVIMSTDEEGVVGGEKIINVSFNAYEDLSKLQLPKIGKLELRLLAANIGADYYKYWTTAEKQASTSASFFAEPTIMYSNCNNGMGIVGSANYVSKVIYTQKIQ